MGRSDGGSPIMPTPQNQPNWTGTMGEALACQRLRTHLDGQELWGKPQAAGVSGATYMDGKYEGSPIKPTS